MDVKTCMEKGYLKAIEPDEELVKKEMSEANYDFKGAEKAIAEKDFKWAIVKSYYAMFHAARAILFKLGLREKRHFAIVVALEELNRLGKLESKYVNDFNDAVTIHDISLSRVS